MARRSLRMSAACHGVGVRRRSLLAGRGLFSCVPGSEREAAAGERGEGAPRREGSAVTPLLRHELQQQLLELERGAHLAEPQPEPASPSPSPLARARAQARARARARALAVALTLSRRGLASHASLPLVPRPQGAQQRGGLTLTLTLTLTRTRT